MHTPFRFSLLSLLTASALCAQGTPPPVNEEPVALEDLVVTAHPYARDQFDLAQPTNVLAGTRLALRQAASLGELLGGETGVSSTYFGPGASRPVIRGLGGDRVRVLENSTGTLDASVTSPDHAVSLDPLLIERVEVVRGPATLLYGNAAIGGVVNVITHRIHPVSPESALNGRFESRFSSVNDEFAAGTVLEGGTGLVAWHFDAYQRESEDVRIPGFAESARRRAEEEAEHEDHDHDEEEAAEAFGRIPNTAVDADGAAFGLSLVGAAGYIGFSFNGHNSLYGVPAGAHVHAGHAHEDEEHEGEDEEPEEHGEEPVRIDLRQRRLDVQGELVNPFAGFSAARFKFGTARYTHQELEGEAIGTVFTNRGYDGRIELLHAPLGRFTGAFGAQAARSRFAAAGEEAFVPPSRTTSRALFLFEEADFQPVVWQAGLRFEDQDIDLRDGSGVSRGDAGTSLSTGLVWTIDDAWALSASLARTERAPNAQELFSEGAHIGTNAFEIGDPALDEEVSTSVDVSLRRRAGAVTGALTVFANRFDGYIHAVATGREVHLEEDGGYHFHDHYDPDSGALPEYRYVQRDAEFYGAEIEAVYHLHESDRHQFDLSLGADLVRGRNTDEDTDLPRITPRRVRAGFTWNVGAFSFGADIQRVAEQDRVAANETPTEGYMLVNANVGYRFTIGRATFDLFARGTNLGDEEARVHTSFLKDVSPLPGRNVTLGFRTSF